MATGLGRHEAVMEAKQRARALAAKLHVRVDTGLFPDAHTDAIACCLEKLTLFEKIRQEEI